MFKLLTPLASALLGDEVRFIADQTRRSAIFYAIIGLLLAIAGIFLLTAAFLALAQSFGGPIAALILAGICIILAAFAALILKMQMNAARRQRQIQVEAEKKAMKAASLAAVLPLLGKRSSLAVVLPIIGVALLRTLNRDKAKTRSDDQGSTRR